MPNLQQVSLQRIPAADPPQSIHLSNATAQKLVNIAGIGAGDRVLYSGDPDAAIKEMVIRSGASLVDVADVEGRWPAMHAERADVMLFAISLAGQPDPAGRLTRMRRHLRRGGRLVVWAVPDWRCCAAGLEEDIRRLIDPGEFTSIIVGRLPSDGSNLIVATAVVRSVKPKIVKAWR